MSSHNVDERVGVFSLPTLSILAPKVLQHEGWRIESAMRGSQPE